MKTNKIITILLSVFLTWQYTVLANTENIQETFFTHTASNITTPPITLIIFSYNRPMQLYALLESIARYVTGPFQTCVLYKTSDEPFYNGYEMVKNDFPLIFYVHEGDHKTATFKQLFFTIIREKCNRSSYIIFAVDDIIITRPIDLSVCTQALEDYDAYGFYLRLGKNIDYCYCSNQYSGLPPLHEVAPDIYTWQFNQGCYDWIYPHTVDIALFRIKDVVPLLYELSFTSPNTLEEHWSCYAKYILSKNGLCFGHSAMVNIPINIVQTDYLKNRTMNAYTPQELLDIFLRGKKIDINPFFEINNNSPHAEYPFSFINRSNTFTS